MLDEPKLPKMLKPKLTELDIFLNKESKIINRLYGDFVRITGEKAIEIGKHLHQVRERLHYKKPGFREWIKREFEWGQFQAYNFIKVYEEYGDGKCTKNVNIFSLGNLLRLLTVEEPMRTEIMYQAEAQRLNDKETKAFINRAKENLKPEVQPADPSMFGLSPDDFKPAPSPFTEEERIRLKEEREEVWGKTPFALFGKSKTPLTPAEFKLVISCLHPDLHLQYPVSEERRKKLEEATALMTGHKVEICGED